MDDLEEELEETPRDLFELFARDEDSFDRDREEIFRFIRETEEAMRPVKCDGKTIGWAVVTDGKVIQLDLEEGWGSDLQKGEHEVTIDLGSSLVVDSETGERKFVHDYLSSKFTW